MNQKTDLTLTQKLGQHLSPQQVRFVRLLEMNGPEIEDEIRHELDENPALDTDNVDNDISVGGDDDERFDETAVDVQIADYKGDDIPPYLLHAANRSSDDDRPVREQGDDSPGLVENLNAQLDMIDAPERTIALARYLVGNLDDNGRLGRTLLDIAGDIAISTGVSVTRDELVRALDIIKYQLDPAGIGAVDLRECLIIQLKRKTPHTLERRAALEIVTDHFDLFSKKHYNRIRGIMGIDRELFDRALNEIISLDPKPGGSLDTSVSAVHITPDFIVTPIEGHEGRFSVTLNQHIPSMTIEKSFTVNPERAEDRAFVSKKRSEATTFISLVNRRSNTLITVMQAIVTIQYRFFETEDSATIRPMILRDLAEITGYDISVISRATSNKYVATESGIYPVKMFFNDRPIDDDTSSAEINEILRTIIEGEDKRHPLSDRVITDEINRRGYALARRTVAKYRERLGIPVARLRKNG